MEGEHSFEEYTEVRKFKVMLNMLHIYFLLGFHKHLKL